MMNNPYVLTADDYTFGEQVIQRSLEVPVLLDCWAPWCKPCASLTPLLERLATEYKGRFELVKVNIDESPQVAKSLRIQSIPFLVLFIQGQPVDALVGNQSQAQLKTFLDRHLPPDETHPYELGMEAFKEGLLDQAATLFDLVLNTEPDHVEALIARSRVALAQADIEYAALLLDRVPADHSLISVVNSLRAIFKFAEFSGNEDELLKEMRADPDNPDTLYRLGATYIVRGSFEEACLMFLKVVSVDRSYREDAGRAALLSIFDTLGSGDVIVSKYRRKLGNILF